MRELNMDTLRHPVIARIGTGISLFLFTFVFYFSPFAMAVTQGLENNNDEVVLTGTNEQKMNQGLLKLKELAASKKAAIAQRVSDAAADNVFAAVVDKLAKFFGITQLAPEDISELTQLAALLAEQHQQALANFDLLEAELVVKGLPAVMLQRHQETVAQYKVSYNDMLSKIQAVLTAPDLAAQQVAMSALDQTMSQHKLKQTHQSTDPNNLPWGTPDAAKTREPGDTAEKLSSLTGIKQSTVTTVTKGMTKSVAADAPGAADLAETPDIQLTDAIKAKALALGNDPLKIYNWVRNNIEFIPSYGSIQGADYTLQHGKGNAFDTASLLIALLRSANVPARYAYGTVEMPVDKVMNWVGGVDVPEAAQQLLGQGGIPNVALIRGGKITHIRLETVWAEAWVDYFPSRGAKHVEGDSWIPLDASFKQYDFTQKIDFATEVPFDAQGLYEKMIEKATINEELGYVQGINQAQIETALGDYQQQVEEYVNNQNPDATIDEILGTQKVIVQNFVQLAAGLPYKLVARTANYAQLPDNLRHKFRYTLGTESYGSENSRLMTFEQSLPELAGKKHAVSFYPATQADEDLMNSYLPQPDPVTGQIDPTQMASTLPGYLINLTAEFTQDGEVISSAAAGTMGGELYETLALWSPATGWHQAVNHPTAGEYRAIGLDVQGAYAVDADSARDGLILLGERLSSPSDILTLGKHDVVGKLFHATVSAYLSLTQLQDQLQAVTADAVNYRLPSFGIFSSQLTTSYWFGLPRNVALSGMVIDVDRLASQTVHKSNDSAQSSNFMRISGLRASAMEHIVPEKVFTTANFQATGMSATKALTLASNQGQSIWTIDKNNLSQALSSINLTADIETDIRNGVLAGKIAVAHQSMLDFNGTETAGYLLLDPDTGAGAYLIASGESGGLISSAFAPLLSTLGTMSASSGSSGAYTGLISFITTALTEIVNGLTAGHSWGRIAMSFALAILFGIIITMVITELLIVVGVSAAIASDIATLAGAVMGIYGALQMMGVF